MSLVLGSFYLMIRFIDDFFLFPGGIGDEWYFTNDLKYFIEHGYSNSVIRGISIPFTLISYLFFLITNDVSESLRITGTFFTLTLIIYFAFRQSLIIKNKKNLFIYLLFLISTTGGSFYGTNDSIFFTSLVIFFHELLFVEKKSFYDYSLLFISAIFLVMSRPIIIIYLTIFFLSLLIYKIFNKGYNLGKVSFQIFNAFLIGILVALIFNYPKLVNGDYSLSFSTKTTTSEHYIANDINWVEWFYYSQLMHNQNGSGFFAPMIDWSDVRNQKALNDDLALPQSFADYLINYKLFIIKRFPKSLIEISFFSIRYVGLLLLLIPLFLFCGLRKNKILDNQLLLIITIFIGIVSWAILWPHVVQHRHLYPFYVFLLFIYSSKNFDSKVLININYVNILIIDLLIFWTLWKESFFYKI